MSTDSTLLLREIDEVTSDESSFTSNRVDINILANGQWIKPLKVDYLSLSRDYSNGQLGDIIHTEVLIGYGDYAYDIVPYRDDLIVEVIEVPLEVASSQQDMYSNISVKRYKGVLNPDQAGDPSLTGKQSQMKSRKEMNQVGLMPVHIQLVDVVVYKMMMVSCGETFRKVRTRDVLISLYVKYAKLLGGTDEEKLKSIDFADGFNKTVRHQLTIPDGTMLKDVPKILQNNEGGIYPTGMGRYIQNQTLHVYPLYDTTRYTKNAKVLNLINVPNDRYMGAENTYRNSERYLTILATGDAEALDAGLASQVQEGNGVRVGNASNIFQNFSISKDNRMLVDKATNLFEMAGSALKDGFNNIRWGLDRLTGNPYKYYTDMARKQGQALTLDWTNGDPDLIYPGMPVKFRTISNDLVMTYHGVVLGVNENRVPATRSTQVEKHLSLVQIGIFINRFESEE